MVKREENKTVFCFVNKNRKEAMLNDLGEKQEYIQKKVSILF